MGIRTVFTDHSLFGFDDAASILTNKLLVGTLRNVDAVICVSHTGYVLFLYLSNEWASSAHSRENTVLRGELFERNEGDPSGLSVRRNVYVIPNALVADQFKPCPLTSSNTSKISAFLLGSLLSIALQVTIIVLSRLAYRKGIDLLVATAPRICAAFPNVRFVVGALL